MTQENFHPHLDVCLQCREHPFNLCAIGHYILTGEVKPPPRPLVHPDLIPQMFPDLEINNELGLDLTIKGILELIQKVGEK